MKTNSQKTSVWTCVLFLPVLAIVARAQAQTAISYSAEVYEETRTATAPAADIGGASYVSLGELVRQFGGAVHAETGYLKIDLAGRVSHVSPGGAQVEAIGGAFALAHPLLSRDNDVWIAAEDVEPFFTQAFQVAVFAASAPPAETPPAETPPAETPPATPASTIEDTEADLLAKSLADPVSVEMPPPEAGVFKGTGVLVIDAGHGGHDGGTAVAQGGLEKDITLALAKESGRILKEETKLSIFLTRSEDRDLTVAERARLAGEAKASLLVSLHVGAGFGPEARGYTVMYPESGNREAAAASLAAAETVARAVADAMAPHWSYRPPRAVPLRLFQEETLPGIVVELGYTTNADDAQLLASPDMLARLAQAIAQGVAQTLQPKEGT